VPFDNLRLKQPSVTVLPPTITDNGIRLPPVTPERGGGGPQRIHIDITITDRRAPAPRRRTGSLLGWIIVLLLIAALAHAQGDVGPRYDHWQDTTTGWHGETRTDGRTTDRDSYGPGGRQKHCHRYFVGDQPFTTCR
jgi:hypothetical protein